MSWPTQRLLTARRRRTGGQTARGLRRRRSSWDDGSWFLPVVMGSGDGTGGVDHRGEGGDQVDDVDALDPARSQAGPDEPGEIVDELLPPHGAPHQPPFGGRE